MGNNSLTGLKVLSTIMQCGITHIVWLPDSCAEFLYPAMKSQPGLTLVPVCREGEAIAIAAGLITGGKKVMVLHPNTGFFESGDSLRGLALDFHLPLILMLGYVGWRPNAPLTKSAGLFFEPILNAWNIKHYLLETDNDIEKISMAYREANETKRPVAVLIPENESEVNPQIGKAPTKGTIMDCFEAEKVISRHRQNAIVVTAQTASAEWPQISSKPDLDIASLPHVMGKASSYGLGLALSLPLKKVIVLDADGALLMNLGSLVTIANMMPSNLIHFVLENDVYRTTGGQPIPGAGKLNFRGLANAAGYRHAYEFDKLEELESSMETIINETGPIFVCLKVQPLAERSMFRTPDRSDAFSLANQILKSDHQTQR